MMAPVEELSKMVVFPHHKARSRVTGEAGPLGVGRCSYSLYKEQHGSINFKSFVGEFGRVPLISLSYFLDSSRIKVRPYFGPFLRF